jgi:hypothetical protein
MSIDGVKFVSQIETRFGVRIADEQVGEIETIGQLTDFLTEQAREVYARPCVAAHMFYRLRKVLLAELPLAKREVRPQAAMRELIPAESRRRVWWELQEEFEYRLPDLQMSATFRYGLLAFAAVLLVAMVGGTIANGMAEYLFVIPFIWALIVWVVMMLAKLYRRELPSEMSTVAATVGYLLPFPGLSSDQPPAAIEPWVFENICQVTANAAKVEACTLTRETHFIRDLAMK